jgi:aspartate-semialdehyde dehydrogenase
MPLNYEEIRVLVIGGTGLVGRTIVEVLAEREFPMSELQVAASAASAGTYLTIGDDEIPVREFNPSLFRECDLVFFAGKDGLSKVFCPKAVEEGCYVIDNSADFRLESGVPLVVPEVNAHILPVVPSLIANPNCTTIQIAIALAPLDKWFGVERVIAATYQSVSGGGQAPLDAMQLASLEILDGEEIDPMGEAFNLIPAVGSPGQGGYFSEELKVKYELRKILDKPDLPVAPFAVRVPTVVGHAVALFVELSKAVPLEQVREALSRAASVVVYPEGPEPTPAQVAGTDDVHIGRIHLEAALKNGVAMWVVADNLRVGAATNAVRIAEALLGKVVD